VSAFAPPGSGPLGTAIRRLNPCPKPVKREKAKPRGLVRKTPIRRAKLNSDPTRGRQPGQRLSRRSRYADQRTENDDTVTLPKRPAKDGAKASRVGESRSRDRGERPAFAKPERAPKKKRKGLRYRQPRRIARETEAEKIHKAAILEMRVCAAAKYLGLGPCRGPLQSAHLGPGGGTARKHGDWTTATRMCAGHHDQIDGRQKPSVFDRMSGDELAAWKEHEMYLAREFVAGRRTVSA
jgi:hypothetical protein